ncbi:MAG: hypothetical protein WC679_01855 [Bacteroidales bacterium]|jgi:hypothetical protein
MNKSTISTFFSITANFITVFPEIREIIREGASADNPEKYIAFRAGGVKSKWFMQNYLSTRKSIGLKSVCSQFYSRAAKEASQLQVNIIKSQIKKLEISGSKNFQRLEVLMPEILKELMIVYPEDYVTLLSLQSRLNHEISITADLLATIVVEDEVVKKPKKKKENSGQNQQLDGIINQILACLNKKHAHELRLLLAKTDNKMQVVQTYIINNNLEKEVTLWVKN